MINELSDLMKEMNTKYQIPVNKTYKTYNECMSYMINKKCYFGNEKEIAKMARAFLEPIEMYIKNRGKNGNNKI